MLPVAALAAQGLPVEHSGGLDPWVGLLLGFVLVLLNAFFVAAEFALVKVRPTQLDVRVSRGEGRARVARHMVLHLDAYLSATQLGITLTSLALGWVGEPAFAWMIGPLIGWIPGVTPETVHTVAPWLAFGTITALHIVLGELAPKSIAIRLPEPTSLGVAFPLYLFYKITFPVIWLLNHTANLLLRLIGVKPMSGHELAHDEEELRLLLASSAGDSLEGSKRELLDNVFELSNRVARQVMVPRADVVYLSTQRPVEENLALARKTGHTRFPLCDGDLDHVIGMVHIKDLFRTEGPITSLTQISRKIPMIPETLSLDRLLRRMREERMHVAAVLDEYGGVSGVVTLENVIEEIVGSIQDEFDLERPELIARPDGSYLVSGAMLVADIEDELSLELSDRDEDTVGGVVLSELGRSAEKGDHVELGPVRFEVVEVQGNRIRTLRLEIAAAEAEDGASAL